MRNTFWTLSATLLLVGSVARADGNPRDDKQVSRPRFDAAASGEQGLLLSSLVAPGSANASPVVATTWAGYDSGPGSPVVRSFVDATVYGPLALRAGISYVPESSVRSIQPHVGARVTLLEQSKHGFDLGVGLFYRMERFTQEEGLAQALLSAAVHFGRTGLFANVAYGQDLEGDDMEGEGALALLHRISRGFQLGVESHARFKLGSSDEKRRDQPVQTFDAFFAPTASYALGPVAVFAEVGPSLYRLHGMHAGVLALAGVGGAL